MFLERARNRRTVSLLTDALGILAAFGVAFVMRMLHDRLPLLQHVPSLDWRADIATRSDYAMLLVTTAAVWVVAMRRSGLYAAPAPPRLSDLVPVYLRTIALCVLFTGAVVFALKIVVSRLFFAYFFLSIPVLLTVKEALVGQWLLRVHRDTRHRRRALVIGAGDPASWFVRLIEGARDAGYELVEVIRTTGGPGPGRSQREIAGRLERAVRSAEVDEVFLIGSAGELAALAPVAQAFVERGRVVSMVTAFPSGHGGIRGRVTEFAGIPVLSFGPVPHDGVRTGAKRALDLAVSFAALVVASPLFAVISLAIRLCDGGPALFKQRRLGLGGVPFELYKFRSMHVDAERVLRSRPDLYARYLANDFKLPDAEDPRITRLGRFLRRTSLDELPQVWNVLRGDMTLVGPRPICPDEIERYQPYSELFLSVRPGLTGSWQVSGRSEVRYPQRAFMDFDYIGSHSVAEDVSILLKTIPAVIRRRGAG